MTNPPVLVVGAGPTGLVTAIQLRRYGVDVRVIDRHPEVLRASKAAALQARALEYLDDLGCIDPIVEGGQRVEVLDLRTWYRDRVRLDFATLPDTRFNYICDFPQYLTEDVLLDRITELGGTVDRGVKLCSLTQDGAGAHVELRHDDGHVEHATYDWVVGADGYRSTVRDQIGQEFHGAAYAEPWALADAKIDWPLPRNEMTFCSDTTGICGVFPLPGDKAYRIAYTLKVDANGTADTPTEENMIAALRRSGIDAELIEIGDFWTFNLAHRHVDRYRVDRVLLAGDAAHVHTPFGGQGLNLGVGDAFNLGWKLALTCTGRAAPGLLDTYDPERHRVGLDVVHATHLGASMMLVRGGPKARARNLLLGTLGRQDKFRAVMTRRLAQLTHTYAASHIPAFYLRVGDRLPDLPFFDGFNDEDRRLYDLLGRLRHTLLFTTTDPDPARTRQLVEVAASLRERYGDAISCVLVSPHFEALAPGDAFDDVALDRQRRLEPLYRQTLAVHVVRPDHHLSGLNVDADSNTVAAHVDSTLRPLTEGALV